MARASRRHYEVRNNSTATSCGSIGFAKWGDLTGKQFRVSALPDRAEASDEDLEANLPDQLNGSLHAPPHVIKWRWPDC